MTDTYDPSKQPGFIFWGNAKPGEPLSYQALQTRRKIAEELMGKRSPFPKNLGEGLTYAGERFADAMNMRDLDASEQRNMAYEAQRASGLPAADTPYTPRETAAPSGVSPATAVEPAPQPALVPPSVVTAPQPPPTPRRPAPVVTAANVTPQNYNPAAGAGDISGGANTFSAPGGGLPGGPAYAGPSGNAPGRFGQPISSPGGATLPLPEQPPAGRFTTALGPTPTPVAPRNLVAQAVAEQQDEGAIPPNAQLRAGGPLPAPDMPATAEVPYLNPMLPSPFAKAPPPAAAAQGEPDARQAQAQATLPSQEPVPSEAPPYETPIPPDPLRPRPLGISKAQADAQALLEDRSINPNGPAATRAKNIIAYQEKLRTELEQQQQADYMRKVQQRDALIAKDEQRKYEAGGKALEDRLKRGQIELAGPQLTKAQDEAAAGKAPEVMSIGDNRYQWDRATRTYKDITPGVDPNNIQLTESQAKTLKFFERATFANQQLRKADDTLAGFMDTRLANTPIVGNYLVSPEYQKLDAAREAWGQSVLRDESGAVLSIPEVRKKLATYFPVPGDLPPTILDKALRRQKEESSLLDSLGKARPVAEQYLQKREGRKAEPGIEEGTVQQSSKGRRRVNIGGYWEDIP